MMVGNVAGMHPVLVPISVPEKKKKKKERKERGKEGEG